MTVRDDQPIKTLNLTPAEAWELLRHDGGFAFMAQLISDHNEQITNGEACPVVRLDDYRTKDAA